ncbi:hypothetical protein COOONC_06845 [Cooperia oncophora]
MTFRCVLSRLSAYQEGIINVILLLVFSYVRVHSTLLTNLYPLSVPPSSLVNFKETSTIWGRRSNHRFASLYWGRKHLTTRVRRLEKGQIVRFHRGGSLLGVDVKIRTTLTGDEPLKWTSGTDHLAVYCQVECTTLRPASYQVPPPKIQPPSQPMMKKRPALLLSDA